MKITINQDTSWQRAVDKARRTVGKKPLGHEPSEEWKSTILLAEHSPIRLVEYTISIEDIKTWIINHFVRHWLGFIPFVHSQRDDRRKLNCSRDELPQGSLNDCDFVANAQALINVSRKRLCFGQPHKETRKAWEEVREEIAKTDPAMAKAMVRECVYRGFCPERDCCGYCYSAEYEREVKEYRQPIIDWRKKHGK